MKLSTAGLAGFSARHPWRVLCAWLIVLVAGIVLASGLADVLTSEANLTATPDSIVGSDLLKERLRANHDEPLTETVIVTSERLTIDDARFKQTVEQTTADLAALGGIVASASNYYQLQDGSLVSADKHTTLIPVTLAGSADDADSHADDYMAAVSAHRDPAAGINVLTIGATTVNHTSNTIAQEDLPRGELIGVGVGLLILIVVLGALVAAGLPILLGVVSIVVAFGLAALVGRTIDLSIFVGEHHLHDRPGGRHRLRVVCGRALPRGAPARLAQDRRYHRGGRHGYQGGRLLRLHRHPGAVRHVHGADLGLPQPRHRRHPGRAGRRGRDRDARAGHAEPAGRQTGVAAQTAVCGRECAQPSGRRSGG